MLQYIVVFGFFVGAFVLFALSLHFSQYKKRSSGCCSEGLEGLENFSIKEDACYTCPNKETDICISD